LKDEKSFVRQAAAERLGEVKARWTAEPLIQKLKDSDPFVREAVVSALESILGRSIGLVASADAATRIAKCRELEEWWKTNKDK
jgi:HEAT repeat protein